MHSRNQQSSVIRVEKIFRKSTGRHRLKGSQEANHAVLREWLVTPCFILEKNKVRHQHPQGSGNNVKESGEWMSVPEDRKKKYEQTFSQFNISVPIISSRQLRFPALGPHKNFTRPSPLALNYWLPIDPRKGSVPVTVLAIYLLWAHQTPVNSSKPMAAQIALVNPGVW